MAWSQERRARLLHEVVDKGDRVVSGERAVDEPSCRATAGLAHREVRVVLGEAQDTAHGALRGAAKLADDLLGLGGAAGALVDGEVADVLGPEQACLKARQDPAGEVDRLIAAAGAEALRVELEALLDRDERLVLRREADAQLAGEPAGVEVLGQVVLAKRLAADVSRDETRVARRRLQADGHEDVAQAPGAAEGVSGQQQGATQSIVGRHALAHLVRGRQDAVEP